MVAIAIREEKTVTKDIAIAFGASLILALGAPFAIPLPFTPVPLVLQCQLVFFLGAFLGSKRASIALLFFLIEGVMGYPVFATGGAGIARIMGPSGGYLIGYLAAAYMVGFLEERNSRKTALSLFNHMAIGNLIVYICGASYLATFVGIERAILLGVAPFILGDLLKLLCFTRLALFFRKEKSGYVL
jgi:biotin transport system substrate-specific component